MKHYTYRITNIVDNKHYYGVRSSVNPKEDLGIKYFSSSKDKNFMNEQKLYPNRFKYKIIKIFDTRKKAMQHEIILHEKMNVSKNENFYNIAKAVSSGFSLYGYNHTEEAKKKIAKAGQRPCKSETKRKMSKANKNQYNSQETRMKKAEANTGIKANKFKGYYVYKNEKYITSGELSAKTGLSKAKIITVSKDLGKIISKSSYSKTQFLNENYGIEIIGKSWEDIGFGFINIIK